MAVNFDRLPSDEAAVHNAIVRGSLVTCDSLQNVLDALNWYRCNEAMERGAAARSPTTYSGITPRIAPGGPRTPEPDDWGITLAAGRS